MSTYRPIAERVMDFKPVELRLGQDALGRELQRCQDCGVPFCHAAGCPLGNAVPEINARALAGRWAAALSTLLDTSPFPEFTSRVCPALCEGSCVQGLHEAAVPCRLAEYEVIERGFAMGLVQPKPPRQRVGLSAAVIGSGPAGLAAAWQLNRAGVSVTVYEKDALAGGFLRYGIPDFKLEKAVIDRRIRLLEQEGIIFEYGVEAGKDVSDRFLRQRHDLIVLAVGARRKRDLVIPGRELGGICFAVDYLAAQNRLNSRELHALPPELDARGKHVVVLGGGDTGSDCVGTARRQGALSVSQYEILPRPPVNRSESNPWPEWPRTLRTSSSHEEGCERRWNISSLAFVSSETDAEKVGGLKAEEVTWRMENNRPPVPAPVPGSTFTKKVDLVLLALGFTGVEDSALLDGLGCIPAQGRISRADGGQKAGAYACGDAVSGPSLVVRAINDGLETARRVLHDYELHTDAGDRR